MKKLFYFIIFAVLYLPAVLCLPGFTFADNDWTRIIYYNSNGENSAELKTYYIISITNSGIGKLEYFSNNAVKEYEFNAGNNSMKKFNLLMSSSGIFNIDPSDLTKDVTIHQNSVLNMTIYFEKNYENYNNYNKKEYSEEEIKEKRKEPFIAVPSDYNLKYSKMVNEIYVGLERLVPDYIWNKASSGN